MKKFHAHVYFSTDETAQALSLYESIRLVEAPLKLGGIHFRPVGPHALPMFTVMFSEVQFYDFKSFLQVHRGNLSILIHEDSGDDYRDHTTGAEWLGLPLSIDFGHFERIQNGESAPVFPDPALR